MKLPNSARIYSSYLHQVSGGQCQRIVIAMALACKPYILIADEPTTALDVVIADESVSALDPSVQKEVLRLINDLQLKYRMAIIFITHDLRVAAQISDYITVMEKGEMVEFGSAEEVFNAPKHNYTKKLLDAAPSRDWHLLQLTTEEAARIAATIERK